MCLLSQISQATAQSNYALEWKIAMYGNITASPGDTVCEISLALGESQTSLYTHHAQSFILLLVLVAFSQNPALKTNRLHLIIAQSMMFGFIPLEPVKKLERSQWVLLAAALQPMRLSLPMLVPLSRLPAMLEIIVNLVK